MRHVDIVPTVLALLGLPGGDTMQGANLLPALEGRVAPLDLPQYSEARLAEKGFGMAPLSGVRHAGRKWIRAPRPELYDLHDDPRELENLYPSAPAVARPLQVDEELVLADSARHAITARPREIDHETEEMLRALGYVAAPEERAGMAGRDPKDGMVLYAELQKARQLAQDGRWDSAEKVLVKLIAAAPENVAARNVLALAAVRRGDFAEGERQYEGSLRYQPRQHRVLVALGAIALHRGDLEEAEDGGRRPRRAGADGPQGARDDAPEGAGGGLDVDLTGRIGPLPRGGRLEPDVGRGELRTQITARSVPDSRVPGHLLKRARSAHAGASREAEEAGRKEAEAIEATYWREVDSPGQHGREWNSVRDG